MADETRLPKNSWHICEMCSALLLCCLSLYLLLGFKVSRVRSLFLKQRNYIKLVKLNRKFSIKFMVLMSDGLFWQ